MKLHTYWRSSAAYRVRIALNLKGLSFETVSHHLVRGGQREPDYLSLNPHGLVPLLEDDGQPIAQSLAIIEYLDETRPQPPLLPGSAVDRAQIRALAASIACDIHPLNNLRVLDYLKGPLGQPADAVQRWYRHWIERGFAGLEVQARQCSADGTRLYGATTTLADLCLVPQMYNARRFHCDLAPYPTLVAIDEALRALEPFARAAPEQQPDAE